MRDWRLEDFAAATVPVAVYAGAGALRAYFARDDFQWLDEARDLTVWRSFSVVGRTHFYRPVAEFWWDGAYAMCDRSAGCYHALMIVLHVVNVLLVLHLARRVFRRRDLAFMGACLWAVLPTYVEAVVWLCAVTTTLAAFWYLVSLHFALAAASRPRPSWASWACIGCLAAALYTHESSATLLATIPLLVLARDGRAARFPAALELIALSAILVVFAATTFVANRHSYVFEEGHYRLGLQAIGHAVAYARGLSIAPDRTWTVAAAIGIVILIAWRGTPPMRVGLVWIAVTMTPYLGFTWGNVGRYTYVPSIGFCWIVAGAVVWLRVRLSGILPARAAMTVAAAAVVVIAGRYALFARTAIVNETEWTNAYRAYRDRMMPELPRDGSPVTLPRPSDPRIETPYIEPMVRWETGLPSLTVFVR